MALSKSQYLCGLQCRKALWLLKHRKELAAPMSPAQRRLLDQGTELGRLARQRYSQGLLIEQDHLHLDRAMEATRAALDSGASALFEAAFEHDGVLARADILLRNAGGAWDLIEVKATTEVKEEHLHDLALQRFVMEGSGVPVRKVWVLHADGKYVRNGPVDPEALFKPADVTNEVAVLQGEVAGNVRALLAAQSARKPVEPGLGPHCTSPEDCAFKAHCWNDVPERSILRLSGLTWKKREELLEEGVELVSDIPERFALSKFQALHVEAQKTGKARFDAKAVGQWLRTLEYPAHFLDFETVNPAVPPYDGMSPFQQLPFQASIHVQNAPGGPVEHVESLGDGRRDPRPALVESLLKAIGPKGSVIAYNASFEGRCLEDLAEAFPQHDRRLLSMRDRLWDLADCFRKGQYVHPGFKGKWSIKAVLPALVPGMSYEGLAVRGGEEAQNAYLSLMGGALPEPESDRIMEGLRRYCAQDTLGMVRLLDHVQSKLAGSA